MSVAIVSYNTCGLLSQCLESVLEGGPAETVVVDNGSTDGSRELVRRRFPSVRLITNDHNRGYGEAANQGIAAWSTPAGLLLNADTVVAPNALDALGGYLAKSPHVAVAGPKLVDSDGRLQRSTFPFPGAIDTILAETGLHLLVRRIPKLRELSLRTWSHDHARPVPWVLGAALAIRRSTFEAVAGFDTNYFMYGEELDLCRRLAERGFETHFAPVTTVLHIGGASTSASRADMRRELVISRRRNLQHASSDRRELNALRMLRLIMVFRLVREALRATLSRIPADRASSRQAAREITALVRERSLWKP